jgi:hypothetical protein
MTVDGGLSIVGSMTDEGTLPSWGNALATIAACGGVGAFIDFYIGKRGQQRVRDWLETWWIRLSYVRWGNFGRQEALFAMQVDGSALWSTAVFGPANDRSSSYHFCVYLCNVRSIFNQRDAYISNR